MKPRVVYLQNGPADASRPTVRISKTNEGITFAITATGRSLRKARERAVVEYKMLAEFVREQEKLTQLLKGKSA